MILGEGSNPTLFDHLYRSFFFDVGYDIEATKFIYVHRSKNLGYRPWYRIQRIHIRTKASPYIRCFPLGRQHPLYQVLCAAYRSTCWQVTLPSKKLKWPQNSTWNWFVWPQPVHESSCTPQLLWPSQRVISQDSLRVNEWGPVVRVGSAALTLHWWTVDSEDPLDGVTKSLPDAST